MNEHYSCDPSSDDEIIRLARTLRRAHGVADNSNPDLVSILELKTITTRFGEKTFHCWQLPDEEMEDPGAATAIGTGSIELILSKTTYSNARFGHGRARMLVATQLGHAVLHQNIVPSPEADRPGAQAPDEPARQADVFALHYLVSESAVYAGTSVSHLAEKCLIPLDAAERLWIQVREAGSQPFGGSGVRLMDTCTACGRPSMLEIGQKSYCISCVRMADAYPDGDGPF